MWRFLSVLPAVLAACGPAARPAADTAPHTTQLAPDFFVLADGYRAPPTAAALTAGEGDCRARISVVMCLTDGSPPGPPSGWPPAPPRPTCLPDGKTYVPLFEALHDAFPPPLQQVFCRLSLIEISPSFDGTAAAGAWGGDNPTATMVVRKRFVDTLLSLEAWASWKEQLSFGGNPNIFVPEPTLPNISARAGAIPHDMLYFVVAHEFGHILDHLNHLNCFCDNACPCAESPTLPAPYSRPAPGSWSALSWQEILRPLPEADFAYRDKLCFYNCGEGHLLRTSVPDVYRGLDGSTFISTYAATNPYEDFADSLAYYLLAQQGGASYLLDTRQGEIYDILAKLRGPRFAAKRQFIADFLQRGSP